MDPDITINVNLPSDGAQGATADRLGATAAAPPPMPIDQLQSSAATFAPSPAEPSALQAQSSVVTIGDAGGPPPMAIDRLQATMGSDAPTPVSFGALQDATAAPAPTLQTSGAVGAEAGDAPAPMSMQDLAAAANGGKAGSRKK